MVTSKSKLARKKTPADTGAAVDEFMSALEHPHKAAIEALRRIICGTEPSVFEGIKWNAPSFRTTEYFATTHLRAKSGIAIIFHFGAKVRDIPMVPIEDPDSLLDWLGKDRAMASFAGLEEVQSRALALQAIVRQWLRFV